jgi:hypothetical protein
MSTEPNHKDDRLSSWKEIAEYLDCKPRTCIRWEKSLGLPIHRLEGAPKSRVYASKLELDGWLRTKLRNGSAAALGKKRDRKRPWLGWLLPSAGLLLAAAAILIFLILPGSEGPALTVPETFDGVPHSSGLFDMYPGDIITTEFLPEGKLRVWRKRNERTYFESWRMAPLRHTSLAIGDLDGDADQEIVAPGYCREFVEGTGQTASTIRFFINAYKRGVRDWWKTTFYDKANCVSEPEDFEFTDIAIGNVDGRSGNEIVLATAGGLSVYRFDRAEGALKLLGSRTAFLDQAALHLRAIRLADLDRDGTQEILVLGNEWKGGAEVDNKGWLVILNWAESGLGISNSVAVNANVSPQSLRTGDVVPGGGPEAVFPVYRKSQTAWDVGIAGWDPNSGIIFEMAVSKGEEGAYRPVYLDIGDIMSKQDGDEVVLARSDPNELVCCFWNGEKLVQGPKYTLDPRAKLTNVFASPTGDPGNRLGRIVACGSVKASGGQGSFYVQVVDYGEGFVPVWLMAGGEETDIKVSYAAFGR